MIRENPGAGGNSNAADEREVLGEIRAEILAYFDEHPTACDCAEAIQQWWILQRVYRYSLGRIHDALDQLLDENLVQRRCLADGREVYARAKGVNTHLRINEKITDRDKGLAAYGPSQDRINQHGGLSKGESS